MKYIALLLLLTSCSQNPDITPKTRIYQPSVLILAPNTTVQTQDGQYISGQTYEVWHSALTVEKLEKQLSEF